MIDTLKPLGDRVLVKRLQEQEKTAGGLFIPDAAKEKGQIGAVVAVGQGRNEKGVTTPLQVKVGDKVIFGKYAGTEVVDNHIIIREDEILGTF
ncbi:10 kDa chaperonin [Candidatus Dependentiae bacterium Noda2021]|nr:10 kDa chaperonin [Candidatus Dependentiae bacterium Noda2021]